MAVTIGKKTVLDKEFILSHISTYDIFKMYYPYDLELNRMCLSPFIQEKTPSFVIGNKYGEITFKAFNSPHKGDCFHFVMFLYNLTFSEAIIKIAKDFRLLEGNSYYERIIQTYEKPLIIKKPSFIQAVAKKFSRIDLEYWKEYHLGPEDLNFASDVKCYSTKEWYLNRRRQSLHRDELCFFYNLISPNGSWIKIYRPKAPKHKKWISNIPNKQMGNLSSLKDCKIGFIQKSFKDAAFTAKFMSPHVTFTQTEDSSSISEENIKYINENCERVYIIFDGDETGQRAAKGLSNITNWEIANPPSELLEKGISDLSDWGKKMSPQAVIDYYIQNEILQI